MATDGFEILRKRLERLHYKKVTREALFKMSKYNLHQMLKNIRNDRAHFMINLAEQASIGTPYERTTQTLLTRTYSRAAPVLHALKLKRVPYKDRAPKK